MLAEVAEFDEFDEDEVELDDDDEDEVELADDDDGEAELDEDELVDAVLDDDGEFRLRYFSSGVWLVFAGEVSGGINGVMLSVSDRNKAKLHGLGVGGDEEFDLDGDGEYVAMVAVSVPQENLGALVKRVSVSVSIK